MNTHHERANVLIEALPYIQRLSGKTIVVKYGVAQTVGVSVSCAAAAVALGSIAHAARILHSCKRAGVQYGDAHAVPSFLPRVV